MKILITGGAGYIGSVLCERLLKDGHTVTVLDNLSYQQNSLFHLCYHEKFDFVLGDTMDDKLLVNLLPEHDTIIPLAAVVGAPACQLRASEAWTVNFEAVRLISTLISKEQQIIFPTTNSGYGTGTGDEFCTEETELNPISIYGQTKVNAEQTLLDTGNAITLRLATVFGMSPRMRLDLMVNDFTYTAVTTGTIDIFEKHFKRNYVHIRDVADCFAHCIENYDKMKGLPFNVGIDDANYSKEELALIIQNHVPNFEIRFKEFGKDPDQRNYIVSNERLRNTGFEAKRTVDEGIKELIKGYKIISGKRNDYRNI